MYFLQVTVSFSIIFFSLAQGVVGVPAAADPVDADIFDQSRVYLAEMTLNQGLELADNTSGKQLIIDEIASVKARKKALEAKKLRESVAAQTVSTTTPQGYTQDKPAFIRYARERCAHYGCNANQLINVMQCESGTQWYKRNRSSGATGILQFLPSTFRANKGYMLKNDYDIWNPYHQIDVAAWMFSRGQQYQWVCKG